MQAETQAILLFIGRLLLGGLFVVGGIRHLFDLRAITQAVAARGPQRMAVQPRHHWRAACHSSALALVMRARSYNSFKPKPLRWSA